MVKFWFKVLFPPALMFAAAEVLMATVLPLASRMVVVNVTAWDAPE